MSFPNVVNGSENEVFNSYSTERVPVGTKMVIEDGREFRFCEAFTTALVVGSLNQMEVHLADRSGEAIGTLDAGVTTLTGVGSTTSAVALNELVNGYIYTDNATTLPMMRIRSNAAIAAGSTGNVVLYMPTPTAIAAANTVSYIKNPWRDIIAKPASAETAPIIGVCKIALAANYFGWVQTTGPCSVLYDSSTTAIAGIGDPVGPDQAVLGACSGVADGTPDTLVIIGSAMGLVEADTEQTPVFLRLE